MEWEPIPLRSPIAPKPHPVFRLVAGARPGTCKRRDSPHDALSSFATLLARGPRRFAREYRLFYRGRALGSRSEPCNGCAVVHAELAAEPLPPNIGCRRVRRSGQGLRSAGGASRSERAATGRTSSAPTRLARLRCLELAFDRESCVEPNRGLEKIRLPRS